MSCPMSCRDSNLRRSAPLQVDAGFLEGIIRGYKAGLLTQNQYNNLTQCETIEGVFPHPL